MNHRRRISSKAMRQNGARARFFFPKKMKEMADICGIIVEWKGSFGEKEMADI